MITITESVARITDRIEGACRRAGRAVDEVTLVAVSKTFPPESILEAIEAGLTHFGESKAQEFAEKVDAITVGHLNWHFVGHLQRNKAKLVVGRSDLFHALDSLRLARAIQAVAERADVIVECLAQVNVSGEASKFGVEPGELSFLLDEVSGLDRIRIRGLMTLASETDNSEEVKGQFELLSKCRDEAVANGHSLVSNLSMGMSGDFEVAIEAGATHVRVGSGIFGPRSAPAVL